jgi:hypothetical protein
MPGLKRHAENDIESTMDVLKISEAPFRDIEGQFLQTIPSPLGPESVKLSHIMADVLKGLEQLETLQPYFRHMNNPFLALLGHTSEGGEASFDYKRLPPDSRTPVNTRFFIRGRGKPKPYPLEDDE